VLAILCDLFDPLLFNLAVVAFGWPGFDGYQTFDKWADQVHIGAFLIVALRDFPLWPRSSASCCTRTG
jgi:hypothetical protein